MHRSPCASASLQWTRPGGAAPGQACGAAVPWEPPHLLGLVRDALVQKPGVFSAGARGSGSRRRVRRAPHVRPGAALPFPLCALPFQRLRLARPCPPPTGWRCTGAPGGAARRATAPGSCRWAPAAKGWRAKRRDRGPMPGGCRASAVISLGGRTSSSAWSRMCATCAYSPACSAESTCATTASICAADWLLIVRNDEPRMMARETAEADRPAHLLDPHWI